jgi:multidrug transporter EmrE-like cation transporter
VKPHQWVFLGLSLVFQVSAVVLGKTAAVRLETRSVAAFLMSPWYLASLACLILQAFFWQLVLREVRLFVAYLVMTSLSYLLVLAASRFFFLERVTILHIVGAVVIVGGVSLMVREDPA